TVTMAVTAMTAGFTFVENYRGGDIIPERNTLIAMDGDTEIRTPHDHCLLVMPALRPSRGHTAVRLGKLEAA
ncbi:MAG TPA: peptidase M14, partial [Rhodopila sp.]|nr:peptidase M14 [Rhodopila sp.]